LDLVSAQYAYHGKGATFTGTEIVQPDKNTRVYLNLGPDENYRLKDMTWEYGSYIHGAWCPIRLDYDNDGDMDLLIASNQENVKLFRNDIENKGNYISFNLIGSPENNVNLHGFGSEIKLYSGNDTFLRQLPGSVHNGRSSQSTNILHFGLGDIESVDRVEVMFSDGKIVEIDSPEINMLHNVSWENGSSVSDVLKFINISNPSPNPSSNKVEISIKSHKIENISLELYDILGNKVKNIHSGLLPVGNNLFSFDVSDLSSGSYRIAIEINGTKVTKQLIVE
jgi:hypothetical protein